jgi:hypothetical protein
VSVFDAVASLSVDLVEADLFGIRSGRIQSNRTGNKRKAQKAFPVGTWGHEILQKRNGTRIQDDLGSLVPTVNLGFFTSRPP